MQLGTETHGVCDFTSLLVVQPAQLLADAEGPNAILASASSEGTSVHDQVEGYFNYPLVVQDNIYDGRVEL
ncbi:hypothetical protein ABZX51_009737 [Aspergillus tubingensis]